jgi:hypothetical protein
MANRWRTKKSAWGREKPGWRCRQKGLTVCRSTSSTGTMAGASPSDFGPDRSSAVITAETMPWIGCLMVVSR